MNRGIKWTTMRTNGGDIFQSWATPGLSLVPPHSWRPGTPQPSANTKKQTRRKNATLPVAPGEPPVFVHQLEEPLAVQRQFRRLSSGCPKTWTMQSICNENKDSVTLKKLFSYAPVIWGFPTYHLEHGSGGEQVFPQEQARQGAAHSPQINGLCDWEARSCTTILFVHDSCAL